MLLSSIMMLRHLELTDHADKIERALLGVIAEGKFLTGDLGGTSTTTDFTNAVCSRI